jgi:transcriptional regulator of heat shock response
MEMMSLAKFNHKGVFMSKISRVIQFRTTDGKVHATEAEAKAHVLETETIASLSNLLRASITTMRPEAILKQILVEQSEIRSILQKYNARLPKNRAA